MGPNGAEWGRMGPDMGRVKKKKPGEGEGRKRRKKKARSRLLFAALALGQQPTGTAIKAPHASLLIYLLLIPPAQ
jgi:hypothetical protein